MPINPSIHPSDNLCSVLFTALNESISMRESTALKGFVVMAYNRKQLPESQPAAISTM